MQKQGITLFFTMLVILFSIIIAPANAIQAPPEEQQVACTSCDDTYTLTAEKSYDPSNWIDAETELCIDGTFILPSSIPVTSGNAGNHWLQLTFDDNETSVTCLYQGGSSQAHPNDAGQLALGMNWNFEGCYDNFNGAIPANQPANSYGAGDSFTTDYLHLTLNGDSNQGTTQGTITLNNAEACQLAREPYVCSDGMLRLDMASGEITQTYLVDKMNGSGTLAYEWDADFRSVIAADGDGILYSILRSNNHLITLNNDGTYNNVGATGIKGNFVAMEFAPNGILYAMNQNDNQIYTINPATGLTTFFYDPDFDVSGGDLVVTPHRELVYVKSDGKVYVVDLDTMTESNSGHLPAGSYTASAHLDGALYAFDKTYANTYTFEINPFGYVLIGTDAPYRFGDATSCPGSCDEDFVLVSDEQTLIDGEPSVPTWTHKNWAMIPGATWIWNNYHVTDPSVNEEVTFTRTFELEGTFSVVQLKYAADNHIAIWVNDVLVKDDVDNNNFFSTATLDITNYVYFGENTLKFKVTNLALGTNPEANPAGFIYKVSTTLDLCADIPYCGDGIVNLQSEECDGEAGVANNNVCTDTCALELTCEGAIKEGLLYATLNESGAATVHNDADKDYVVSLASYEMYAALIEDQVLYSGETKVVGGNSNEEFTVYVPECAYQIDVVCGETLQKNPQYGERVMNFTFANQDAEYCAPRDNECEGDVNVNLRIKEGFPQNGSYVFECSGEGFTPTSRYWYFGDGEILPNTGEDNVFHTYAAGHYTVSCTAAEEDNSCSDSLEITVDYCEQGVFNEQTGTCEEEKIPGLDLATTAVDANGASFDCVATNYTPNNYDWDFGDNTTLLNQTSSSVHHEFESNGEYMVTCTASDDNTTLFDTETVVIKACDVYNISFTNTVPPTVCIDDSFFNISGEVHIVGNESLDLTGNGITVNGEKKMVFINDWSAEFEVAGLGPVLITAQKSNSCGETFTAETYVNVNECIPQNGGGGGGCYNGYHKVGETCVKNPVLAEPPITPVPVQEPMTEPSGEGDGGNSTDGGKGGDNETGGSSNLLTGNVTGITFGNSWPWLLALLGLIIVLFGASQLFKK